jgi:hypothetical protein
MKFDASRYPANSNSAPQKAGSNQKDKHTSESGSSEAPRPASKSFWDRLLAR